MSQCPCPNSNSSCLLITEFTWVSTTHVEQLRVQRASQHKMESRLMQNHSKHFSRTNLTVEANIHICSLSLPLPSFSSISPSLPDPFSPFHTRQKCTKVHADKLCYFFYTRYSFSLMSVFHELWTIRSCLNMVPEYNLLWEEGIFRQNYGLKALETSVHVSEGKCLYHTLCSWYPVKHMLWNGSQSTFQNHYNRL